MVVKAKATSHYPHPMQASTYSLSQPWSSPQINLGKGVHGSKANLV